MRITIKTLTDVGKQVLNKTIEENNQELKNKPKKERQLFYNTWKEYFLTYNDGTLYYSLILKAHSALGATYYISKKFSRSVNSAKEFNSKASDEFNRMVLEIDSAMKENGAVKDIDYIIEVLQ